MIKDALIVTPNPGGRPRLSIDWATVEEWATTGISGERIAQALLCSKDTLDRRCREERGESFAAMYARKRALGAIAVASHVAQAAQGAIEPTMPQIVAGIYSLKVREGWYDRQIVTGADGGPIRFALADVGDPGRLVEGSATEIPELPEGQEPAPGQP